MKFYRVSLGAGLLVGVIYSLLQVRSPIPPVGLFGILIGEHAVPLYRWLTGDGVGLHSAAHVLGNMPGAHDAAKAAAKQTDTTTPGRKT